MRPMATDWLNPLMVDARYAPLFLLDKGTVELIEAENRYLLVKVADKRQVARRTPRAGRTHAASPTSARGQYKLSGAASERHAVQIDTAALRRLLAVGVHPDLRLLKSNLGEWTLSNINSP